MKQFRLEADDSQPNGDHIAKEYYDSINIRDIGKAMRDACINAGASFDELRRSLIDLTKY